MSSKNLHLVEDLFDPKIQQKPTRDGYGTGVVNAALRHPEVVVLGEEEVELVGDVAELLVEGSR